MPPRDWRLRLKDILAAIQKLRRHTAGMTFEAFAADEKTIDAVCLNFAVIGEAAARVPETVTARFPDMPWADMRDMRNVIVHEYFGVDATVLWKTIQSDLPPLIPLLEALLAEPSLPEN